MISPQIYITRRAAEHVKKSLTKEDPLAHGLRIGVKSSGCSGYRYVIEPAMEIREQDIQLKSNGIRLIIDQDSLSCLAGCELDFVQDGLNSKFKFSNPNVQASCGCGESFSIKEQEQTT